MSGLACSYSKKSCLNMCKKMLLARFMSDSPRYPPAAPLPFTRPVGFFVFNLGTSEPFELKGPSVSPYLDVREIATELRVSVQTVNRWCRTRRLAARRAGRKWLVRREDLDAFLRANSAEAPELRAA